MGKKKKHYGQKVTGLTRCKECEYFEYNHFEKVCGIPLIVGHEICTFWGDGCKTNENAFCSFAKPIKEK